MTTTKSRLCCAATAAVVTALGFGAAAQAQETTTAWSGAPRFSNESLTFKVRGRTYMDYVYQDVDRAAGADFTARNSRIRTARIGVEGTYGAQWAYKAEVNFREGAAEWEDLILEFKPNDMTSVMLGNFKTVSLENITSSRYTTFMERGPFNDLLDIGRVATAQVKFNDVNWTLAGSVSGNSLNSADVAAGDERLSAQVRGTFAPIMTDSTQVHLGAWARTRDGGDEAAFNYRVRNNTNFGDRYTATGSIGQKDVAFGVEGAIVHNTLSLQGEWATIKVDRVGAGTDPDLTTGYVYASWFPTGESRRYSANTGEFNRIKINNPMNGGGYGAVELGLRYDYADLSDLPAVATAGEYSAWTVGANWHPIPYVRFMTNYTVSENDGRTPAAEVDVKTLQFRAQFDF